ncbi:MAG: hypothetical protein E6G74_13245, partial [Alphaproteobacteria bacterium]
TSHRCAGSRPARPLVLCAGMAVVDFIFRVDRFPSPSTKAMAREFFVTGGGNAANATIAITRLGGRARFCGPVGDDEFGQRVLYGLLKEGVDIGGAQHVKGAPTSVSGIFVDPAGERLLTTRRASRRARRRQARDRGGRSAACARLARDFFRRGVACGGRDRRSRRCARARVHVLPRLRRGDRWRRRRALARRPRAAAARGLRG